MITAPTYFATYTSTLQDFANQHQDLLLTATSATPYIKYSKESCSLVVKGNSSGDNIKDLYQPVIEMLKMDALTSGTVNVDLFLNDVNSSTIQVLFDLFKSLNMTKVNGGNVKVIWRAVATNPDMIDTGLNFSDLYDLDFELVTI